MAESGPGDMENDTIVVVDPDPASRNASEELEDDFDRQIIAMDSVEFDTTGSEEVVGASVYIISWDLNIRHGADLLEEIRHTPGLAKKIVLIASESPTESMVQCAMELGADGVCTKPYDADAQESRKSQTRGSNQSHIVAGRFQLERN